MMNHERVSSVYRAGFGCVDMVGNKEKVLALQRLVSCNTQILGLQSSWALIQKLTCISP